MARRHLWLPIAAVLAAAAPLACGAPDASSSADAACEEVFAAAERLPGARARIDQDSFPAFTGPEMRHGCVVQVLGSVTPEAPVPALATTFPDSLGAGWERDVALAADGPAQTVYGLWRGDVLCLVRVDWRARPEGDAPVEAGSDYSATVGCEALPDRVVPRS